MRKESLDTLLETPFHALLAGAVRAISPPWLLPKNHTTRKEEDGIISSPFFIYFFIIYHMYFLG